MKIVFVTRNYYNSTKAAEKSGKQWYQKIMQKIPTTLVSNITTTIGKILGKTRFSFLVGVNPFNFLLYAITSTRRLKDECKRSQPDIIHIHSYSGFVTFPPQNIPAIITLHDEPFVKIRDTFSHPIIRVIFTILRWSATFMRNLLLTRTTYVHALSSSISNMVNSRFNIKSVIIPNPFEPNDVQDPKHSKSDLLKLLLLPKDAKIVLTVGDINFRKGIHRILNVAQQLPLNSKLYFVIVGKAPNFMDNGYLGRLKEISEINKLNIRFTGFVSSSLLTSLYSFADAYLSASISEASSLALLEAASHKIPIVATDVGSAKDLFNNEAIIIPRYPTTKQILNSVKKAVNLPRIDYSTLNSNSWEQALTILREFYQSLSKGSR